MKAIKLRQKIILAIGLSTLMGSNSYAETIDVSSSVKDIKVMTRIMEASLESASKDFPGRPKIEGTYLAEQGYLFNIQLNGIAGFGIPGVASWENGRLELDIPEIIGEALANVDFSDNFGPDVNDELSSMVEPVIDSFEGLYDSEELQQTLRDLREKQREVRREAYQLRREIRKSEDEKKRQELEQKLEKNRESLKQYSEKYSSELNSYKAERQQRQIKKSSNATDAVFNTICEYGQSLRALKKDEKFTLILKGGVGNDGKKAAQVYVIEQKSLTSCSDSKKLQNNAIHYSL